MQLSPFCASIAGGVFAATAAMAAATQANIADPNVTSRVAKVEAGNRVAVQAVAPSTFFHSAPAAASGDGSCVTVAVPPAGKALVIRHLTINVQNNQSPGAIVIIAPECSLGEISADVNVPTVGQFTATFDPGLTIPNGSFLGVRGTSIGTLAMDVWADGYKVDPSVAP